MRKEVVSFLLALALSVLCPGVSFGLAGSQVELGGLGDLLIYPYFNARGSRLTFVKVANVSDYTVVAKVRLREGVESRELADFVVCLSPHDQFSFWIARPELFGYSSNTAVIVRGGIG